MIDLVVSIVVYNESPSRLEETLAAINSQKYRIVTMVADNGSDEYFEIEALCRKLNVGFFHSSNNLGFGGGHNLIFSKAPKSRFYLVLNPDLTLRVDTIDKALGFMEKNQDVGLVAPKILNPDGTIQPLMKRNPTFLALLGRFFSLTARLSPIRRAMDLFEMKDIDVNQQVQLGFATGCCMFIRSDIFKRVGGFDPRYFLYFEDADITRHVNEVSKALYLPEIAVTHEWRRANQKKWRYRLIAISSAFKYFRKWGFKF